ncbi:MAG: hypothetical protein IKD64_08695, partial [Lachnospiraceae bacterium]|nr:hypothetical protein [Lachnospiraceae bacterium]
SEVKVDAGTYPVTFTGVTVNETRDTTGNYVVVETINGSMVISPAPSTDLGLTVINYNGAYDGESHAGGATATVTEGTTIQYSIDGGETWTDEVPSILNVGSVPYKVKATNPNYEDAIADGTLTVTPKPVTVTADNKSKDYDEEDPALTATVNGLIGEDTISYTLSREEGDDVGTYTITATPGEGAEEQEDGSYLQGNYKVTYVSGTFTIVPSDENDITVESVTAVYDGNAHSPSATALREGSVIEYSVDGGETWSEEVPSLTNVGTIEFSVRATNDNYETVVKDGLFITITPAAVTVTAANATKVAGANDPTFTATVSGLIGTDTVDMITYSLVRAAGEEAGTYAITPTGEAVQGNYSVTYVAGTLTITPAPAPDPVPEVVPVPPVVPPVPPAPPEDIEPPIPPRGDPEPTTEPATEPQTEDIVEPEPPKGPGDPTWALLNLILSIIAVITAIVMAITFFFAKKKEDEEEVKAVNPDEEENKKSYKGLKFLGIIPAAAAVILFILTENLAGKMILTDKWTILTAVFTVIAIVLGILTRNKAPKNDDENNEQA